MNVLGLDITRTGHAGFMIKTDKIIYFDPYQLQTEEKADIIFISHEHYDHCSIADIQKIIQPSTVIVTVPDCQSKLAGLPVANVTLVKPGDKLNVQGLNVEVVPAYNLNKQFHPMQNEWVGFIVTINNVKVYHAGDTDFIPEMRNLVDIGIALVPVSGEFVMTAQEAADAVNSFRPKIAIPMHYGAGVAGTKEDAERFKTLAQVEVVLE
jgi:L-ascorbate metabolism protein UlaG (beta-lactamase superfamily)